MPATSTGADQRTRQGRVTQNRVFEVRKTGIAGTCRRKTVHHASTTTARGFQVRNGEHHACTASERRIYDILLHKATGGECQGRETQFQA